MNETFRLLKNEEIEGAARFIANLNSSKEHHIGYCGTEERDILSTLQEDFLVGTTTTLCAYSNDDGIQALIGLDIDEDAAEVWGPFSTLDDLTIQQQLWTFTQNSFPSVSHFQFFMNNQNKKQVQFMEELHANKTGEHLYLEIVRTNFQPVIAYTSRTFIASDFNQFKTLHTHSFPNTYYDAEQILHRFETRPEARFKVLANNDELRGYCYYELDENEHTAHIEYIAVNPDTRGLGLGTTLLKEVLTDAFSYDSIDHITLTVNNTNENAYRVYLKAGFVKKNVLSSYSLKV